MFSAIKSAIKYKHYHPLALNEGQRQVYQGVSISEAAKAVGVPYATLRRRCKVLNAPVPPGHHKTLGTSDETQLCTYI